MNQIDPNDRRTSSTVASIANWFRYSQTTDQTATGSNGDLHQKPTGEQPDYGAYNEAYVMHHWASFGPRY